jgi:hypothetical protein
MRLSVCLTLLVLIGSWFLPSTAEAIMARNHEPNYYKYCARPPSQTFFDRLLGLNQTWTDFTIVHSMGDCPEGLVLDTTVQPSTFFWPWLVREFAFNLLFFLCAFCLGAVTKRGLLHTNNTRKLLGTVFFVAPMLAPMGVPSEFYASTLLASFAIFFVSLLPFLQVFRNRSSVLHTAFASIDRPEDRPHTLLWFATSNAACFAVLAIVHLNEMLQMGHYVVVVTAVIVGDIVSGFVGYNFGRYRYRVPSLLPGKRYTRSIEGTAAFYFCCVSTVFSTVNSSLTEVFSLSCSFCR